MPSVLFVLNSSKVPFTSQLEYSRVSSTECNKGRIWVTVVKYCTLIDILQPNLSKITSLDPIKSEAGVAVLGYYRDRQCTGDLYCIFCTCDLTVFVFLKLSKHA
jgi:hypothetical protein